jgi:hypothetical protein
MRCRRSLLDPANVERALRRLQREQEPKLPFVFTSERNSPFTPSGFARMIREYLTEAEVERLMKAASRNRWGHRDSTMILVAYRHGLRVEAVPRHQTPPRAHALSEKDYYVENRTRTATRVREK